MLKDIGLTRADVEYRGAEAFLEGLIGGMLHRVDAVQHDS